MIIILIVIAIVLGVGGPLAMQLADSAWTGVGARSTPKSQSLHPYSLASSKGLGTGISSLHIMEEAKRPKRMLTEETKGRKQEWPCKRQETRANVQMAFRRWRQPCGIKG